MWWWSGADSKAPTRSEVPAQRQAGEASASPGAETSSDDTELPPLRLAWPGVDLEEVRRAMPDNRYWSDSAPTDDPATLARREQAKARWNDLFGKVQSGTATEDQIAAFYEERQQVSEDNVAFVRYLLEHHAEDIPERDQGMLLLAADMNQRRLQQLPDERDRALQRKRRQDEARASNQGGSP
ncbi:MAG: hypothetical protein KTR31_30570 [Myxococcales bacterium]|nr:hypothetical protein [Myxococcales bacterium]